MSDLCLVNEFTLTRCRHYPPPPTHTTGLLTNAASALLDTAPSAGTPLLLHWTLGSVNIWAHLAYHNPNMLEPLMCHSLCLWIRWRMSLFSLHFVGGPFWKLRFWGSNVVPHFWTSRSVNFWNLVGMRRNLSASHCARVGIIFPPETSDLLLTGLLFFGLFS